MKQLTKDINDTRVEAAKYSERATNNDKIVQEIRNERDIFKKMRD